MKASMTTTDPAEAEVAVGVDPVRPGEGPRASHRWSSASPAPRPMKGRGSGFGLGVALVAVSALAAGCAGGGRRGPSAKLAADAPKWVNQTSYVDKRTFYGVGASAGVKNMGLARSRAGNNARNEVAKVVETYSASLMKDYAASISTGDLSNAQEEQLVEQAVKTFTAQLLTGVEVTSYYRDNGGVVYALAELNLDRQAAIAAAKTKMGPGLSEWVKDNQDRVLDDLQGGMRQEPPRPPPVTPAPVDEAPPVATAPPAPAPAPPPAVEPPPTVRSCDSSAFLCATGQGSDQDTADVAARAELARIFEANIQSVAQSYASAARTISSQTGEKWIETSQFSQQSLVTTNKVVRFSRILGRWKDGNIYNSLVAIDRAQAGSDLRARIQSQDEVVRTQLQQGQGASDAVQRLKHARAAVSAFVAREALNSDLRVVRADGRGIPSPVPMSDLLDLLQQANRQLSLGIALAGRGADRVQACLEEAMTNRGYEVESNVDEQASRVDIAGSFDVLIKGQLRAQELGRVRSSEVVQVRLTLRLINGKSGRVLKTITGSQKGTRASVDAALSTAAYQLCKKKVPGMIRDIDRYFVR